MILINVPRDLGSQDPQFFVRLARNIYFVFKVKTVLDIFVNLGNSSHFSLRFRLSLTNIRQAVLLNDGYVLQDTKQIDGFISNLWSVCDT